LALNRQCSAAFSLLRSGRFAILILGEYPLQIQAPILEKLRRIARSFRSLLNLAAIGAAIAAILCAAPARAAQCGDTADGFDAWLAGFKRAAAAAGISRSVIDGSLSDVAYDDSVISHDRGQGVFHQSFAQFSGKRVTSYRVKKGRNMLLAYAEPFERIEQRYGVPAAVLVAIWGLETEFGAGSGNYPTFTALATLAYDCRRAEEFRAELMDALEIVQRGDLQPSRMRSAWAGEIGQTQFLPSAYLKYAVAIDGGRAADLIGNAEDALASTANFLHAKGWRRGAGWDEGEPNFAVLLEWNKAPVYAKTIGLFADRLEGASRGEQ
jgi:lytic murein transglycosylase